MAYQVALADLAKADAERIYDWVTCRLLFGGQDGFKI